MRPEARSSLSHQAWFWLFGGHVCPGCAAAGSAFGPKVEYHVKRWYAPTWPTYSCKQCKVEVTRTRTALPHLVQFGVIAGIFFGLPRYVRAHLGELGLWSFLAALLVLVVYVNGRVRYKVAGES